MCTDCGKLRRRRQLELRAGGWGDALKSFLATHPTPATALPPRAEPSPPEVMKRGALHKQLIKRAHNALTAVQARLVSALEDEEHCLQIKAARDLELIQFKRDNWGPKIVRSRELNARLDRARKRLDAACLVAKNKLRDAEDRVKELEALVQVKQDELEFQTAKVIKDGCPAQSNICPPGTKHALTYCVKRGRDVATACNAELAAHSTTRAVLSDQGLVEPDVKLETLSLYLVRKELEEEEWKRTKAKEEAEEDA